MQYGKLFLNSFGIIKLSAIDVNNTIKIDVISKNRFEAMSKNPHKNRMVETFLLLSQSADVILSQSAVADRPQIILSMDNSNPYGNINRTLVYLNIRI